jgi:hypothetical protein
VPPGPGGRKGVAAAQRRDVDVSPLLLDQRQRVLEHVAQLLHRGLHGDRGLGTEEGGDMAVQLVLAILPIVSCTSQYEGCISGDLVHLQKILRKFLTKILI